MTPITEARILVTKGMSSAARFRLAKRVRIAADMTGQTTDEIYRLLVLEIERDLRIADETGREPEGRSIFAMIEDFGGRSAADDLDACGS